MSTTKNVIHEKKTEQITNSLVEQNNEVINHNLVKTNLDDLQKIVKTAMHYLARDSTTNHSEKIRQRTYSALILQMSQEEHATQPNR